MTIRNDLITEVKKYLVGPSCPDETLPSGNFPLDFYISGLLFPVGIEQDVEVETLAMDSFGKGNEESTDASPEIGWLRPNSIGIRCNIGQNVQKVNIEIEYAKYVLDGNFWKRKGVRRDHEILLDDKKGEIEINGSDEIESAITWNMDEIQHGKDVLRVLTVFLSNSTKPLLIEDKKGNGFRIRRENLNKRMIFQPSIKVFSKDQKPIFAKTIIVSDAYVEDDDDSLNFLFRDKSAYAQGYGCAASWDNNSDYPKFVKTEIIPSYTAKKTLTSSDGGDDHPVLIDMNVLANAKKPSEIEQEVTPVIKQYETWIEKIEPQITELRDEYPDMEATAEKHLKQCKDALNRMKKGLTLLTDSTDPKIFDAFVLANKAMQLQRVHYDYSIKKFKGKAQGNACPHPSTVPSKWRPFQIAFILMNLESMCNPNSEERKIADLLWIPTGAGKTEAYLGLAAFTMLLRRMTGVENGDGGSGTSVIMRYTLRLLTIQQFERASALMCALEVLRRSSTTKLGDEPFLIGLWLGSTVTPNQHKRSRECITRSLRGEYTSESPSQLLFCPWCGQDLDEHQYNAKGSWTVAHCRNSKCEFWSNEPTDTKRALPIVTVDEDIYRRCPALLISTVDKFARIAWEPMSASIFGLVDRHCSTHGYITQCEEHSNHIDGELKQIDSFSKPDLIIQDELHLISGPIGTIVGLYETVIDYLCSDIINGSKISPKIIASTATIKNVDNQIKQLFNRDQVQKFPPPGIDPDDFFFWWNTNKDGRTYIGTTYSHKSMKFALSRLYASLLQKVHEIKQEQTKEIDPYYTLVGYFNSRRELGGALRLVEDDVPSDINSITELIPGHKNKDERKLNIIKELTGRKNANEIREIRGELENNHNSGDAIDVLLATNMISVGIDVERLGLMVISGQPKNSTEYIQVTGRIGRRYDIPGLVFTMFSPYKPRDLSHYENFTGNHLALQKSVEHVSLTPFSERALERALHAIYISLIRMQITSLNNREDAGKLEMEMPDVIKLQDVVLDRLEQVQKIDKTSAEYARLKGKLQEFIDNWEKLIKDNEGDDDGKKIVYQWKWMGAGNEPNEEELPIMIDFADKKSDYRQKKFPLATPGSMRDVEKELEMYYG